MLAGSFRHEGHRCRPVGRVQRRQAGVPTDCPPDCKGYRSVLHHLTAVIDPVRTGETEVLRADRPQKHTFVVVVAAAVVAAVAAYEMAWTPVVTTGCFPKQQQQRTSILPPMYQNYPVGHRGESFADGEGVDDPTGAVLIALIVVGVAAAVGIVAVRDGAVARVARDDAFRAFDVVVGTRTAVGVASVAGVVDVVGAVSADVVGAVVVVVRLAYLCPQGVEQREGTCMCACVCVCMSYRLFREYSARRIHRSSASIHQEQTTKTNILA